MSCKSLTTAPISLASLSPASSPATSISPKPLPTALSTPMATSYPVEVVAGSGAQGFQDGPALQASFNKPGKPCLDPHDGSLYIPDTHMLRKLTPDGQIKTVAGALEAGYHDGPAEKALFNTLTTCAVDGQGNVMLLDILNHRLRQLSPTGQVTTLLIADENAVSDVNGETLDYSQLSDIVLMPDGDLIIANDCHLRRYAQGHLTTLNPHQNSGVGPSSALDGNLATKALLGNNLWLAADPHGNLYLADQQVRAVRRIDLQGMVTTLTPSYQEAQSKYGQAAGKHSFSAFPLDVAFDSHRKRLYTVELGNIFEIALDGTMNLIAGHDLVPKDQLSFALIRQGSLVMGKDHHLYVVDSGSHQLKRVVLPSP